MATDVPNGGAGHAGCSLEGEFDGPKAAAAKWALASPALVIGSHSAAAATRHGDKQPAPFYFFSLSPAPEARAVTLVLYFTSMSRSTVQCCKKKWKYFLWTRFEHRYFVCLARPQRFTVFQSRSSREYCHARNSYLRIKVKSGCSSAE